MLVTDNLENDHDQQEKTSGEEGNDAPESQYVWESPQTFLPTSCRPQRKREPE